MKVIAFDPSSSVIGYAVSIDGKIIDAGLIKPHRTKDDAPTRIRDMRLDVCELIDEHDGTVNLHHAEHADIQAVIESPSKHVGARHKGNGAGLAIYGWAVGMVHGACLGRLRRESVHVVSVDEWTRGRQKKSRLAMVKAAWPAWTAKADPGMDAADAIALAMWLHERLAIGGDCVIRTATTPAKARS